MPAEVELMVVPAQAVVVSLVLVLLVEKVDLLHEMLLCCKLLKCGWWSCLRLLSSDT